VNILKSLTLPALRHIELAFLDDDAGQCWREQSEFISLISRSACSLEKLTLELETKCLSEEDLIQCLEATPTLTHLEIQGHATAAITRKVLSRMTRRGSHNSHTGCLVPRLVDFRIGSYRKPYKDQSFSEMIQSRWKDNTLRWGINGWTRRLSCLRTVEITLNDIAEGEPMPRTLSLLRKLEINASVMDSEGKDLL
jgi:hypothetical protein